jgi:lauroyl/myristoyl acyltransferase
MNKAMIYQVTATSLDDGFRIVLHYFANKATAETKCALLPRQMEAAVLPFDCLVDEKGNYYEIPIIPLRVGDSRERILSKLTKDEIAILGIYKE